MHLLVAFVFMLFIIAFKAINSTSVIDAIYILCSYTYGPLLGLFAFSLLTKRQVNDRWSPWVCIASPLICFAIDTLTSQYVGYKFGYEPSDAEWRPDICRSRPYKKETVKYKQ